MLFTKTKIQGVFVLDPELIPDARGFFARAWCQTEFEEQGIDSRLVQCNISFNKRKGTLRGMHYQKPPHAETKIVRCTMGSLYDVAIDLRPDSPTFKQWVGDTLSAANHRMMVIPPGCAHGFLTLEDTTEIFYQMSAYYAPPHAAGVRWNDPAFRVRWPGEVTVITDRDDNYPYFKG
ncbi:MAG TPA: dTDP-4-dehydrorhamnose 3,5-epimerase [Verrucomicrobiae bacterium]|nr:dTDP-4-dehydrorhamnose 3,5-epimerase [Verrucomicrobiae bacterium]